MIVSQGHGGRYRLVNTDTGVNSEKGDPITSVRGDIWELTGGRAPHNENSTGRVYVKWDSIDYEFYPAVFNLKWELM